MFNTSYLFLWHVRHKNVRSNVLVGHIMISLYHWNSNINKLLNIKIGSEQNVNYLKTIYFQGRLSIGSDYAEAAFMKTIFLHFSKNFTLEKSYMLLIYNKKMYNYYNILQKNNTLAKKQHGFDLNLFFGHPNTFITQSSVILTMTRISYIILSLYWRL